jgi:hypothetical protein
MIAANGAMNADLPRLAISLSGRDCAMERIFRAIGYGSGAVDDPGFFRSPAISLAQRVLPMLGNSYCRGVHGADLSDLMLKGCIRRPSKY